MTGMMCCLRPGYAILAAIISPGTWTGRGASAGRIMTRTPLTSHCGSISDQCKEGLNNSIPHQGVPRFWNFQTTKSKKCVSFTDIQCLSGIANGGNSINCGGPYQSWPPDQQAS